MFNSFGNIFRLTSFGESHGPGVGGVIDGFPAGIDIDMDFVQKELNRRRPGQSLLTTSRKEPDTVASSMENPPAVPLVSWYGTRTNILTTTRI